MVLLIRVIDFVLLRDLKTILVLTYFSMRMMFQYNHPHYTRMPKNTRVAKSFLYQSWRVHSEGCNLAWPVLCWTNGQ